MLCPAANAASLENRENEYESVIEKERERAERNTQKKLKFYLISFVRIIYSGIFHMFLNGFRI